MNRTAILFRIHYWDASVARRYAALRIACQAADIWIVSDDTRGEVPLPSEARRYRITAQDALASGFAAYPADNVYYHNADYPLYLFFSNHPEYEYYGLCEHDVELRKDVSLLSRSMYENGIDFLSMPNRIGPNGWSSMLWTCSELFDALVVTPYLVCFCLFSRKAVALLRQRRLEQSNDFHEGKLTRWPYCEGYIATQLRLDGCNIASLSDFVNTSFYDTWPPYHEQELGDENNCLYHPVLSGERYVRSMIRFDAMPASTWLTKNSRLRAKLSFEADQILLPELLQKLIEKRKYVEIFQLLNERRSDCLPLISRLLAPLIDPPPVSLGDAKDRKVTAWQSSTFGQSEHPRREEQATSVLHGPPSNSYRCHTDLEYNPWWMVDLGTLFFVANVAIRNRADAEKERLRNLTILTSIDAKCWFDVPLTSRHIDELVSGQGETQVRSRRTADCTLRPLGGTGLHIPPSRSCVDRLPSLAAKWTRVGIRPPRAQGAT